MWPIGGCSECLVHHQQCPDHPSFRASSCNGSKTTLKRKRAEQDEESASPEPAKTDEPALPRGESKHMLKRRHAEQEEDRAPQKQDETALPCSGSAKHKNQEGGQEHDPLQQQRVEEECKSSRLEFLTEAEQETEVSSLEEQRSSPCPLNIASGGLTCVGWSAEGLQEQFSHESEVSHALFIGERMTRAEQRIEHLFFHRMHPEVRCRGEADEALASNSSDFEHRGWAGVAW